LIDMAYSKKVIETFKNPRHYGKMKNYDGLGKVGNPVCVISSTRVHINCKTQPICTVRKEDRVLSHDGKYHPIKSIYRHDFLGKIFVIKNKLGKTYLTADHLILAAKIPKTWYFSFTKNKKRFIKDLGWYHAQELEKKDIIAYPILKEIEDKKYLKIDFEKAKYDFKSRTLPQPIKISPDFLRLIGYYLAEGDIQEERGRNRVGLTFDINESEHIDDVYKIVKNVFALKPYIRKNPTRNTARVDIHSVELVKLLKDLCGKGAADKHIPHFMMLLPPKKQISLIQGLWRGGGYLNTTREYPRGGYSTISHQLAQQLKMLLLRQGIIPSMYEEEEKVRGGLKHKKSFRVHVGQRSSLEKLCKIMDIPFHGQKEVRVDSWIDGDYAILPITGIKYKNYRGAVWNLEVKNSRSFTTPSLCLHNCGDVMWLYIKVSRNKKGEDVIKDISFETFGCIAALASSSIITEVVKGKTIKEALKVSKQEVLDKLGGLPPIKIHCSVLAIDALREAIYDFLRKDKKVIPDNLEKRHQVLEAERKQIEEKYSDWINKEEEFHSQND